MLIVILILVVVARIGLIIGVRLIGLVVGVTIAATDVRRRLLVSIVVRLLLLVRVARIRRSLLPAAIAVRRATVTPAVISCAFKLYKKYNLINYLI